MAVGTHCATGSKHTPVPQLTGTAHTQGNGVRDSAWTVLLDVPVRGTKDDCFG